MAGEEMSAAALDVLQRAMKTLAAQNRLLLRAAACATREELGFHILNHTAEALPYDRAVLLEPQQLLGISGSALPDRHSALAQTLLTLNRSAVEGSRILSDADVPAPLLRHWQDYRNGCGGCSVLRIELGAGLPALWLERWNSVAWRESEMQTLLPLCGGYADLWRRLGARRRLHVSRKTLLMAAGALLVLALVPLRLRIVAPCEVIAQNPSAIAAKIDGVIERVLVRPGQRVERGARLVQLQPQIVEHELEAARQATGEAYARYVSARSGALHDPAQRAQLPELGSRLREEQARLALAEFRAENLRIDSPAGGVAVIGDPDEWAGRPVTAGERILQIADPARTRVRIYLPLSDKIDFPPDAPVKVLLSNDSASSRSAILRQVAAHASDRAGGETCFFAEADWQSASAGELSLGVSGTAVVYGKRVPLLYWLLRRPLAALRGWSGI